MTHDTLPTPHSPDTSAMVFQTSSEVEERAGVTKTSQSGISGQVLLAIVSGGIALATAVIVLIATQIHEGRHAEELVRQAVRKDILNKTSAVTLALRTTRKLLVNDGVEAAAPARIEYDKALKNWYQRRAELLDRAQMGFGPSFANLIGSVDSKNYITDRCGVLVRRDDPARGKDCATRLDHEVESLTARQDASNQGKPFLLDKSDVLIPEDFTSNLRAANTLIDRVSDCKKSYSGVAAKLHSPVATRCPNLRNLQFALNLRVNLVGMSQEAIEKALPLE